MADLGPLEYVYGLMRDEVLRLNRRIDQLYARRIRAETTGGVVSMTLAQAPLAADGGVSNNVYFTDVLWIKDGLKPGEVTGAGTGVLAVYSAALDQWLQVGTYVAVTI